METATLVAAGWTTGINAYLTVLMLGLAGRFGWAETPAELQQSWVLALAAHLSKTSTRLAINVSPEPFTNIAASLAEDGLVAALVSLALIRPRLAAFLAAVAAAVSLLIGFALFSVARRGYRRVRRLLAHWVGRTGGTPGPVAQGRAPPGAGSLH